MWKCSMSCSLTVLGRTEKLELKVAPEETN
jgi:hypothetical protein